MVIQLQPSQVGAMWDAIKYGALEANRIGDGKTDQFLNDLLAKLLSGEAQAWMFVRDEEGERKFLAVAITCICKEPLLNYNYLLVHSVYAFERIAMDTFNEGYDVFEKFAQANDCLRLVAITQDEKLLSLHKRMNMIQEFFVSSKTV